MAKKQNKKISKIIKTIITLLFLIITGALIFSVHRLGMIPNKYMILGSLILVFLNLIAALCLFSKKKWPKVFTVLLYILILGISIIGINFSTTTNKFLDTGLNNVEKTYKLKYYVLSATELTEDQLNNTRVTYYENSVFIDDAIKKLGEKFAIIMLPSNDIYSVFKTDLFYIDENTLSLFKEEENFDISKYTVVYTVELTYNIDDLNKQNNNSEPEEQKEEKKEEQPKKKDNSDHYFNLFVGAFDFSGKRMDMNKIITINTKTNEILITNIHRYAYLDVPGYSQKNTLSSMAGYGVQNNVNALSKLLDIKIDYYLAAKTDGLVKLIDDIGGIEYCSDVDYITDHALVLGTYDDTQGEHFHVKKGCQHVNGIQALTIARERLGLKDGSVQRDRNTTAILMDILEQMRKPQNITRYPVILNDLAGMYQTTIPRDVLTSSIKRLLNNGWSIKTQEIRGRDGMDKINFSNLIKSVAYMKPESVAAGKAKIKALDK